MNKQSVDVSAPIGVFDSGVGGLTVLNEIHRHLPLENTIYLGDTARVPYGIRTPDTVKRYSLESGSFLFQLGIKLLVIACNTVSAISLDLISRRFPIPVIGVIAPGSKAAMNAPAYYNRVGVIGTETTIKSGAYKRQIHTLNSNTEVIEMACPLFVPLVEEGWFDGPIAEAITMEYLKNMAQIKIDALVLGCTHYPLLKRVIQTVVGNNTLLVDSAIETAKMVKGTLDNMGILNSNKATAALRKYYVTDGPERFIAIGKRFLTEPIKDVELIDINCLEIAPD